MEVYVVRHGETVWNSRGLLQGSEDIELNENGINLAKEVGERYKSEGLTFDRVYSSPLKRAFKTAQLLTGLPADKIIVDNRLREISFGVMEGHHYLDFFKEGCTYSTFFSDPTAYCPPEKGESFEDVLKRTGEFMNEVLIPACGECKRILVVAHGNANKALTSNMEGRDLAHYWGAGLQKNCSADIYVFENGSFKIKPGTETQVDTHWGRAAKQE